MNRMHEDRSPARLHPRRGLLRRGASLPPAAILLAAAVATCPPPAGAQVRGRDVSPRLAAAGRTENGGSADAGAERRLGALPADFEGLLPCADCPGIRYRLRLFPDRAYHLRTTYLRAGHDACYYDVGAWAIGSDGATLVLRGGRETQWMFAIRDASTLRRLDMDGREIEPRFPHDLRRTAADPMEPRLSMRGVYRMQGDRGWFTECASGQRWPVVGEGDRAALERAHAERRRPADGGLMVTIEGRLAMRGRSDAAEPGLIVERFAGASPGESCEPRLATAELLATRWRLIRLGDEAVTTGERQSRPYLQLDPRTHRVTGYTGCNRISGRYDADEQGLRLGPLVTTRMACPPGTDTERTMLAALEATRRYRILGGTLDLFDDRGRSIARFEALGP